VNAGRFRFFPRRMGQDIRAWPMLVLLLLIVLVAIGCVLWFMREAMRNERLAVRQKLADAYRGQLAFVQQRVLERWTKTLGQFDGAEPATALFARAAREGWADSAIFLDAEGRAVYPRIGGQGRLAEANAELLALESDPQNPDLAGRLRARVSDYESDALPSSQRRFLMRELLRFFPGESFPTLAAEDLAARYLEAHPTPARPDALRAADLPGVWHAASPGGRAIVLFQVATLRAKLEAAAHDPLPSAGVRISALAPNEDATTDATLVTAALGAPLPGWRLGLSLEDRAIFDTAADRRVAAYLWTGSGVIAAMTVLAFFVARGFGRQVQLARLKNDLVATRFARTENTAHCDACARGNAARGRRIQPDDDARIPATPRARKCAPESSDRKLSHLLAARTEQVHLRLCAAATRGRRRRRGRGDGRAPLRGAPRAKPPGDRRRRRCARHRAPQPPRQRLEIFR
jgi:hypothetical protein